MAQRSAAVPRWIAFDFPIMFIAAAYEMDFHGKAASEVKANQRRVMVRLTQRNVA